MSKRFRLVEDVPSYLPEARTETDIESVLNSPIPDDQKVKLLSEFITKYKHYISQPPTPIPVQVIPKEEVKQEVKQEFNEDDISSMRRTD